METTETRATQVPQPPQKPIVGNLTEIDSDRPIQSMMRLARQYGPFYKLNLVGRDVHVASSQALVDELCDETRFNKRIHAPVEGNPRVRGRRPVHRLQQRAELGQGASAADARVRAGRRAFACSTAWSTSPTSCS